MRFDTKMRFLLFVSICCALLLCLSAPSLYAATNDSDSDEDALRFVMDNLFSYSKGIAIERSSESVVLVAYYLAEEKDGKAKKFNYASGMIPLTNSISDGGLCSPGDQAISKGWKVLNKTKAPGSNPKVAKLSVKGNNRNADLKITGPGNSVITVSKNGYQATLPIEVRVPEYRELELSYGTKKDTKTMQFGNPLDTHYLKLTQGESWTMKVTCIGGSAQIPGADEGIRFMVDKQGNGFWSSDNTAIVTVTSAGKLKAVAEGKAEVTFVDYLGRSHTFVIEVEAKAAAKYTEFELCEKKSASKYVAFDKAQRVTGETYAYETLQVGKSLPMELRAMQNSKSKSLPFFTHSSDPNTAYIDSSKNIQGLKEGTVTISVIYLGQGSRVVCELDVTVTKEATE